MPRSTPSNRDLSVISLEDLKPTSAPFGPGEVLLTVAVVDDVDDGQLVTCVAPTGVRLSPMESEDDLASWRTATWTGAEDFWAGAAPAQTRAVPMDALAESLPRVHYDWVLAQLGAQRQMLIGYLALAESAGRARPAAVDGAIDEIDRAVETFTPTPLVIVG